ncbi:hypothetical protein EBR43_04725 [bacterium]|nr:hypothetical protein [bacterium]
MSIKTDNKPEVKPFIGQHVTEFHYTDRDAWEVIEIISPRRIKIRELDAELTRRPKEFYPGGFSGHYADNHAQEYKLSSNPNNKIKVLSWRSKAQRWSEVGQATRYSKFGLHQKGETATKFYDYNF